MKISIIIPVYNSEKYILRCLKSLLNQNLSDYEIIVINDGSTDSTLDILTSISKSHEKIVVHSQENQGQAASRNKGMELAKGDYLYFIDADDYLAKGVLCKVLEHAIKKNLQILTFDNKVVYDSEYLEKSTYDNGKTKTFTGPDYINQFSYKNECWWYVFKNDFRKTLNLKFREGMFMEDAIFTTKLFTNASRISKYKIDTYRYSKVENSTLSNRNPQHYKKVIYDTELVIKEFSDIITKVENGTSKGKECLDILKTRRDSFVFFVIIRVFKSQLSFSDLWEMLMRIKQTGGYPLKNFIGKEYNKPVYKVLTPLFNNKTSLYSLFKGYRLIK